MIMMIQRRTDFKLSTVETRFLDIVNASNGPIQLKTLDLGVSRSYLFRLIKKLEKENKIKRKTIREGRSNITYIEKINDNDKVHGERTKVQGEVKSIPRKFRVKPELVHSELTNVQSEHLIGRSDTKLENPTKPQMSTSKNHRKKNKSFEDAIDKILKLNTYSAQKIKSKLRKQAKKNIIFQKNIMQDFYSCLEEIGYLE